MPRFYLTLALLAPVLFLSLNAEAQIYTPQWNTGGIAAKTSRDEAPGKFQSVSGVTLDGSGNLYVASDYSVQKFDRNGKFLLKFGERGTGNGQFQWGIGGIAVDRKGSIYLSDWSNHRIQKFDEKGVFTSTFGTRGKGNGQFDQPYGLATDRNGNLLVLDASSRVQKFDSSGRYLASVDVAARVKRPVLHYTPDNRPASLAVDGNGNLYVGYSGGHFVQKFSPQGLLLTRIDGFDDVPIVTVDKSGKLYVLDTFGYRVQVFVLKGAKGVLVSKFRAPDPEVTIVPKGIAVDAESDVYIGASGNGKAYVRKFRRRYLAP